ncbi:MAG: sugar ABC transporter permease [Clostridia bacterium]
MGYLFLLPSLIGVCLLLVFPMADTVRRSLLTVAGEWRGLGNFRILMDNASFRLAALNTVRFLVTAVPLLMILSLGAALMAKRAPAFLKSSLLVPLALPVASLALLWRALLDAHGLVNAGLTAMGMSAVPFMDSGASFWVLVLSYVWKNIGYDMVLLLSALMNVPGSLYEAAQIDGANRVKQFRYITLPHLYPALFVTAVLSVINAFKVFREAYLVAGNYPHEDMYLLQHLFNNWFLRLDIDKLCGAATLVALAMMALILLFQKVWGEART